jgi:hypothetical protein
MKGFVGLVVLALGILIAAASCNGANEVAGLTGRGVGPATTPHPRPTPDLCRQNPADCDPVRSEPRR